MDGLPAESQFIHSTRVEVFHEYVCALNQFCQNFLAVGGGGVECERFLVAVELQEIVARTVGVELKLVTRCVARSGTFDFYNFGAEPCEHLRAGRTGLYVGEVNNLNAFQRSGVHSINIFFSRLII